MGTFLLCSGRAMSAEDNSYQLARILSHKIEKKGNDQKLVLKYKAGACNWHKSDSFKLIDGNNFVVGIVGFYDNTVDCDEVEQEKILELKLDYPKGSPANIVYLNN